MRTVRSLSSRNRDVAGHAAPVAVPGPPDVDQPGHLAPPAGRLRPGAPGRHPPGDATSWAAPSTTWCWPWWPGRPAALLAERDERLDARWWPWCRCRCGAEEDRGALGNKVSAMLVSLATRVEDPAARLRLISAGMRPAKEQHATVASDLLARWAQALAPAVATRVARLLGQPPGLRPRPAAVQRAGLQHPRTRRAALPGRGPAGGPVPGRAGGRGGRGQRHGRLATWARSTSGSRAAGTWCPTSRRSATG